MAVNILRILDYIFILRPMLHLPVWTIAILGFYRASSTNSGLLPVLFLGSGLAGAVFILNQIYDIESDRLNDKIFFLPRQIIKLGSAWLMVIVLNMVSIILAFYISLSVGVVALVIIMLGVFYSVPPLSLKNKTWWAVIANGIGHGTLVFLLGFCAAGGSFLPGIIKSLPYFFSVAAVYIGTTLPDIEGDKQTSKLTLGSVYSEKRAKHTMMAFYILSLISGFALNDTPFLIAAIVAAPFYIWSIFAAKIKPAVMAIKISIISLSLAAGYFEPSYIIFLVFLIVLTRVYYKFRFNLVYPSIK
jgi:4-hydroxybenzoate polyprenyltransferase